MNSVRSTSRAAVLLFVLATPALCAGPASQPTTPEQALFRAVCEKHDALAAVKLARSGKRGAVFLGQGLEKGGRPGALCAWALWQHPQLSLEPQLRSLLLKTDQVAGYWAARALGRLGKGESVPALAAMLPREPNGFWELFFNNKVRLRHRDAGNVKTPEFAPASMPNIRVAYAAMEALGEIGGGEASACLLRGLQNQQYLIRYGAARGLGTMRCREAIDQLDRVAAEDPVLIIRRAARSATEKTRGTFKIPPPSPPPAPPGLVFIKSKSRTESNLGFRDSYWFPKVPWYHWGENLYLLSPVRPDGTVKNLTQLKEGAVQGPEISYDAKKILFAMRKRFKTEGFHIYEMNVDGTGLRQLTFGDCNDVDPYYLPDGRIVFCSDRAGYREYYHQERSRVLYTMDADGGNIQQITFNPNQDYEPMVMRDGRILYSSYRFYGQDGSRGPLPDELSLQRIETVFRTIRGDGVADNLLYGAMRGSFYTPIRPMPDGLQYSGWHPRGNHIGVAVSQAREMDDERLICITPAGLTRIDLRLSPIDCEEPFYPEIINLAGGEEVYIHNHDDMNPIGRFTTPYPAGGQWVFVSHAPWHNLRGNAYGIYLFDMVSRKMIPVYDDPAMSDIDPIPVVPRPVPPVPTTPPTPGARRTGRVLCASVFNTDLPFDKARAKYVRVIEGVLQPLSINANANFRTRLLGTVPLADDGSFFVEVPADTPLRFELLDEDDRIVVHETAFNYVRPGETKGCIGCHEPKNVAVTNAFPAAAKRSPGRALRQRGDLIYQGVVRRSYSIIARE